MASSSNGRSWTEGQIQIARKQFQALPEDDNVNLNQLMNTASSEDEILHETDYILRRRDIRLLVDHNYNEAVSQYENIVQPYLTHICNYVTVGRSRTRGQARAAEPKCAVLLDNFIQTLQRSGRKSEVVAQALRDANCKGEDMAKLDYVFIPHRESTHWALLGIAPKQRMIFLIDSAFWSDEAWRTETNPLTELVWQELVDTDLLDRDWLLITPSYNNMNHYWQNRIYVRQKDEESCAIFVCTNALCLAFGYPLLCYSNEPDEDKNDMPKKRRRMAVELLRGGFVPENYNYSLLDVPTEFVPFQTQADEDRVYMGFDVPPNCREPPGLPWFQNFMTGRRRAGAARAVKGKKKKADVRAKMPQAEEKEETSEFKLYKKSNKPGATFLDYPVYEGKHFPKQFPRKFFEARTLFRGKKRGRNGKVGGIFDELSKKQLILKCRKNKKLFKGFTSQSRKGLDEFRKWVAETVGRHLAV